MTEVMTQNLIFNKITYGDLLASVSIRTLSTLLGEHIVTPGKSISHTG